MILDKKIFFMHQEVGRAVKGEKTYQLSVATNLSPMVTDLDTGITFHLTWPEIVDMAEGKLNAATAPGQ